MGALAGIAPLLLLGGLGGKGGGLFGGGMIKKAIMFSMLGIVGLLMGGGGFNLKDIILIPMIAPMIMPMFSGLFGGSGSSQPLFQPPVGGGGTVLV